MKLRDDYRRMEKLEGEEWEVADYYVDDDECEEKQEWSSRIMDAGKKLIMTGVLIASVQLVLPPLLAVSALGFAMSVPFGVVFASYTATHKLMSKLLPLRIPSNYQLEYSSNEEEEEEEMKMQSTEDAKNEIEMRIELVDDEDPLVADADDNVQVDIGRERGLEEERERGLEEEEERESMKEPVEESADDGESSSTSSKNKNIMHVVDDRELDGTQKKMSVETKQGPVSMDDDDMKQGNHDTPADEDQVKMAADDDSLELKKEKHISGLNGGLHESGDDEEIWKKINAIRVIVGFKAPRHSVYLEEVKALYLFTGIEPLPTTTSATSSELDAKLSFLMSVIGLK